MEYKTLTESLQHLNGESLYLVRAYTSTTSIPAVRSDDKYDGKATELGHFMYSRRSLSSCGVNAQHWGQIAGKIHREVRQDTIRSCIASNVGGADGRRHMASERSTAVAPHMQSPVAKVTEHSVGKRPGHGASQLELH